MANVDRDGGFRPRKNLYGSPWQGMMRKANMTTNATDIYLYDPLEVDGAGAVAAAEGSTQDEIVGVAMGFGRHVPGTMGQDATETSYSFDPSDLELRWLDASAITNAEFIVYFSPAYGVLYEVQTASDLDLDVFEAASFAAGAGSTETGLSTAELDAEVTGTQADVMVIENVTSPDNDISLANAAHLVTFLHPVGVNAPIAEDGGAV